MYLGKNELTVTGSGSLLSRANLASLTVGVISLREEASLAAEENAHLMGEVLEGLQTLGIHEQDLQTTGFEIFPRYDYVNGEQVFIGYEAVNRVKISTKDFSLIPKIIDQASSSGATEIGLLSFSYDDPAELERVALERALINAYEKAQSLTSSLSIPLQTIPVKIIEEDINSEGPSPLALSAESFSTAIFPGDIRVSASVRVTYYY